MEDHHKLIADKETYAVLGQHCSLFWANTSVKMVHVRPTSEPYKAFGSPVTEIALFSLREGESKEKLEEYVSTLAKRIDALDADAGAFGPAWGPVVEHDNKVVLFVGWTSVEVLRCFVLAVDRQKLIVMLLFSFLQVSQKAIGSAAAVDLIANIRKIADVTLVYVKLSKWV